jgi:maleylpyruvate isomerase
VTIADAGGAAATVPATAALVRIATERLLTTLAEAADGASRSLADSPSLLPGWTRGHVATHIARNADSFTWMLDGVVAGELREQYPGGPPTRAAAIDAGSTRSTDELVTDVERSATRFASACSRVDADGWSRPVRPISGEVPASQLVRSRLREVEVHHADLGMGYGPADWLPEFVESELPVRVAGLAVRLPRGTALRLVASDSGAAWEVGGGPASVTVGGARSVILAWLLGRDAGDRLEAPAGLPALTPW